MEDEAQPPPLPTEPLERAAPGARTRLAVGQHMGKRYEVRRLIAEGGMGAVYVAWDALRGEEIALKILLPELFGNEQLRKRFLEEARNTSALRHENIVSVYDVQIEGDEVFLTMELLKGETLHERMRTRRDAGRNFSTEEALDISKTMLATLDYAHRKHVVHRDIKPNNVFLCSNGTLKIMDFGIARFGAEPQLTQPGAVMGTPRFMPPEQLQGEKVDHRADQFACAMVLCDVFGVDPPATREKKPTEVRPDVPAAVFRALDKALSPARAERHADMPSFYQALSSGAAGKSRATGPARRPTVVAGTGVLLLVLGGGGALAFLNRWGPFAQENPPAGSPEPARGEEGTGKVDLPLVKEATPSLDQVTDGTTALIRAVQEGKLQEALRLLGEGAQLEVAGTRGGLQALHVAAQQDATEIARELLRRGARVDSIDGQRRTALHHAAVNRGGGVLALLLEQPGNKDRKERVDVRDGAGNTPLHLAARAVAPANVRLLLAAGAERQALNDAKNSALHELALADPTSEQVEVAELVLQPRPLEVLALVNGDSRTAQALARERGSRELEAYLAGLAPPEPPLASGPEDLERLDGDGLTALMRATQQKSLEDVWKLLRQGARVDTRAGDKNGGCFVLHLAALEDEAEIASDLLERGARVDATDTNLATPLHYCARSTAEDRGARTARVLLEHMKTSGSGHIDAQDKGGDTPLMEAARYGNEPVWILLLEAGAERRAQNENGYSALHVLAGGKGLTPERQRKMAEASFKGLLPAEIRALLDSTNENLETPADLARQRAPELYEYLSTLRKGL